MCMVEIQQGFAKRILERREEVVVRLGEEGGGGLGGAKRVWHPSPAPSLYRRLGGCAPSQP